jgi:hypothetical protein
MCSEFVSLLPGTVPSLIIHSCHDKQLGRPTRQRTLKFVTRTFALCFRQPSQAALTCVRLSRGVNTVRPTIWLRPSVLATSGPGEEIVWR